MLYPINVSLSESCVVSYLCFPFRRVVLYPINVSLSGELCCILLMFPFQASCVVSY